MVIVSMINMKIKDLLVGDVLDINDSNAKLKPLLGALKVMTWCDL